MIDKKANFGSVFIYVLAAVIGILIIMIGISGIESIRKKACIAESEVFSNKITETISVKSASFGSVSKYKFAIPCNADRVYFLDLDSNVPQNSFNSTRMIQDEIDGETENNVFIFKGKKMMATLNIEGIRAEHPFYRCFSNSDGNMYMMIEGIEKAAKIDHEKEKIGTAFDCTNYSLPHEYSVGEGEDDCEEIIGLMDYHIYRFFPSIDEAIQKCRQSIGKIEIDREFIQGSKSTEVKIKVRSKSEIEIENLLYFELMMKQCISSLSDKNPIFTGKNDENIGCDDHSCQIVSDDPLIVWQFEDIGIGSTFNFKYDIEDTDIAQRCIDLIKGLGIIAKVDGTAPTIISDPKTSGMQVAYYYYPVKAIDPDGDEMTYHLDIAPSGMDINSQNGLITWTPDSKGEFRVLVYAKDTKGLRGYQDFNINVDILPQASPDPKDQGYTPQKNEVQPPATPPPVKSKTYKLRCKVVTETGKVSKFDDECDDHDGGEKIKRKWFKDYYECWDFVDSQCSHDPSCPSGSAASGPIEC